MADEDVTVKGSPVRSLLKFLETELTPEQREQVFATLPADFAARIQAPILPTETIPLHLMNRLTVEAAKVRNVPVEEFARKAGRDGAADAVKGIYRFFVAVLTPAALLSKASQMWTSLYNRGDMRVEEQTNTSALIRVVDFPSEAAGCARITGWIEGMAEMTGVKNVSIEKTQCFAKGNGCCEWRASWR
jgi:predicted hydrocarbon binding protein